MHQFTIRNAETKDLDRCYEIERACFPPSEAASRESIDLRYRIYSRGFLVAEIEDQVVGLLNSAASNQPDLADEELKQMVGHQADGENIIVFSLAVDSEFRRRGVSRALLESCATRAVADRKTAILLLCKGELVGFYKKMGYRNVGPSKSSHGGSVWFEMRLDLTTR